MFFNNTFNIRRVGILNFKGSHLGQVALAVFSRIVTIDNKNTVIASFHGETGRFGDRLDRLQGVHVINVDRHTTIHTFTNKNIQTFLFGKHQHGITDVRVLQGQG